MLEKFQAWTGWDTETVESFAGVVLFIIGVGLFAFFWWQFSLMLGPEGAGWAPVGAFMGVYAVAQLAALLALCFERPVKKD